MFNLFIVTENEEMQFIGVYETALDANCAAFELLIDGIAIKAIVEKIDKQEAA